MFLFIFGYVDTRYPQRMVVMVAKMTDKLLVNHGFKDPHLDPGDPALCGHRSGSG